MELTARKLLTVVTEAALEATLVREIETLGARGYTITDARGKGGGGKKRDASWAPHANIRLEVLCGEDTARTICAAHHVPRFLCRLTRNRHQATAPRAPRQDRLHANRNERCRKMLRLRRHVFDQARRNLHQNGRQ